MRTSRAKRIFSLLLAVCVTAVGLFFAVPQTAYAADYELYYTCGGFIRVNRYTGVLKDSGGTLTGALVIPETVEGVRITSIDSEAFFGCTGITSVSIPGSITTVGDGAFRACSSISSVKIGEGVRSLGKDIFRYCYALKSVSLPSTITVIDDYAFYMCIALPEITIPSGVRRIGKYAFSSCTSLKKVTLPSALTAIDEYCFSKCTELEKINLPSGLSTISLATFDGCTSLKELRIPAGVSRINGLAFRGCTSLARIEVPDSVESLASSAFDNCNKVTLYVNKGSFAQAFAAANDDIDYVIGTLPDGNGGSGGGNGGGNEGSGGGNYGSTPFTDDKNHWGRKYIEWAYAMGYIYGKTDTTFAPEENISRGQLVAILYRMEKNPTSGTSSFKDVSPNAYYSKAVAWAESNNIVAGIDSTHFGPSQNITRQQMAAILYRYCRYKNKDVTKQGDLSKYRDVSQISSYAGTAMAWAVGEGIINGMDSATLLPKGNATRAQTAVMLYKVSNL